MKKLSLLMFAILILGCGTEKPVVEEPPVIEEPPPVPIEQESIGHPLIAKGSVTHGQVNVDPEPLNRSGFRFLLTKSFLNYGVTLRKKDGPYLFWDFPFDIGEVLLIKHLGNSDFLEYDTEYEMVIRALNHDCEFIDIVIQFRTKPQRPVVGRPAPVIQERLPVAPLGERLRWDIDETHIVAGNVAHRANNVNPEPLNANGIHFEFSRGFHEYEIDLRLKDGASLGWLPRGLVDNEDLGKRIQIMPGEGAALLDFDTEYEIEISVLDLICRHEKFTIRFWTMPEP